MVNNTGNSVKYIDISDIIWYYVIPAKSAVIVPEEEKMGLRERNQAAKEAFIHGVRKNGFQKSAKMMLQEGLDIIVFAGPVMLLWNFTIAQLFEIRRAGFLQSIGLLLLIRLVAIPLRNAFVPLAIFLKRK